MYKMMKKRVTSPTDTFNVCLNSLAPSQSACKGSTRLSGQSHVHQDRVSTIVTGVRVWHEAVNVVPALGQALCGLAISRADRLQSCA
jgi:hypothetical protein